ncbi:cytochrome P450 [Actinospica sp.]|jgi:cytochrome P450|uniref:cytochrome P450 n=1 Tax=Actinospica sp. TaxID=1872142 RepID=UPI002D0F1A37|nr:cytochrome P450 [Actinospica sp.]HWG27435.1 cytochrome P450 [Actinospica sp.]
MEAEQIVGALMTPKGRGDPYPLYAAARELGPVRRVKDLPMHLCTGYAEINAVLRDNAFGKLEFDRLPEEWRSLIAEDGAMESFSRSVLEMNPPNHRRVRSLMSSAFTQRRVAGLEPAIVRMTEGLLDELAALGEGGRPVDFMENFAFRLPVNVICELLGVPEEDRYRFRPLAHDLTFVLELTENFDDFGPADAAAVQLRAYFTELAERRRAEPQDDLVSALVQVNDAHDGRLSDAELLGNLLLLLVAGFETTTNLLGNGLYLGFEHPEVLDLVRKGEISVAAYVEEVLRHDSPVQLTSRIAVSEDARIGGHHVPPGEQVMLLIGAANRDPARFENPDVFDPTRSDNVPLSFGAGIHYCLGQGLARLEGKIAFEMLLERFPVMELAAQPERRDRLVLRGYQTLPITVSSAA